MRFKKKDNLFISNTMNNEDWEDFLYNCVDTVLYQDLPGNPTEFKFKDHNLAYIKEHLHDFSISDLYQILILFDLSTNYINQNHGNQPVDLRHRKKIIWVCRYLKEYLEKQHHGFQEAVYAFGQSQEQNLNDAFIPLPKYGIPNNQNNMLFCGAYKPMMKENYDYYQSDIYPGPPPDKYQMETIEDKMVEKFHELAEVVAEQNSTLGDMAKDISVGVKDKNPQKIFSTLAEYLEKLKTGQDEQQNNTKIEEDLVVICNDPDKENKEDDVATRSTRKNPEKSSNDFSTWGDFLDKVKANSKKKRNKKEDDNPMSVHI